MPEKSKKSGKKLQAPRIAPSAGSLQPGDIVTFNYKLPPNTSPKIKYRSRGTRLALVVSNNSGNGVFVSNPGNRLVSCFTLSKTPAGIRDVIITKLYKKRRLSNYYKIIASLKTILGKEMYRTYNLNNLSNLREIEM